MDERIDFIGVLQRVYTTPLLAVVLFGALFIIVRGTKALRLSRGTALSALQNLWLILFNAVIMAVYFGGISTASNAVFETLGLPHINPDAWSALPTTLAFIIVLVLLDFNNYWSHRLLHTKLFWGLHALHHSDEHMTWTTSYRVHVLEFVQMKIVYIVILGVFFLPPEIVAVAGAVRGWYSKFIHCQLGWGFGRFAKVLASPNYHRWHHADVPEAYGKNLCDMFPVWDVMFGTHYNPGHCDAPTGVSDAPTDFLRGQAYPFVYALDAVKRRLPKKSASLARNP
ncbi:sterol desaturase family protein [Fretibacter rubidus]|uniref:sterol desaturase family protein n=1 Tax=Fretibacter rubidus TaxID=570162 RepID=UPI00352AC69D